MSTLDGLAMVELTGFKFTMLGCDWRWESLRRAGARRLPGATSSVHGAPPPFSPWSFP